MLIPPIVISRNIYILGKTKPSQITHLLVNGLNVARVKMVKVILRSNEIKTVMGKMYKKTCLI